MMTGTGKMTNLISVVTGLLVMLIAGGCANDKSKIVNEPVERHEAQVQNQGAGMIYVDKIACDAVMRNTDSNRMAGAFHCYLVGFTDSLSVAKAQDKKTLETGKYYQFDVQNDWVAMVHGDSVMPVFYQPKQGLESHRYEGVIVFETNGEGPDTLIYKGSSSNGWGPQQLVINSNKK